MAKQLIYVGDPMCSWCWGFSPVMRALAEQCDGRAAVSFVAGGLRPGATEPANEERRRALRHHWDEVQQRTGQLFRYDILERDDFVFDTEPSCRAAVTVRALYDQGRALSFFADLQRAFYTDCADITDPGTLADLANQAGLDRTAFVERFAADDMAEATRSDFDIATSFGVMVFPTVVARDGEDFGHLTAGYRPYEMLQPGLENWLEHGFDGSSDQ